MTDHHSQRRSAAAHPEAAMIARLDQFAAAIADARTQPNLAALADLEQQFLTGFHEVGAHLDRAQVGAAWMILGNLFAGYVGSLNPEQQGAGPVLVNLARLAGARLYTGDRLPVEMRCPFTFATGAPCAKVITGSDEKQFDTYMRAHIWQQHPGEEWPRVALAGDGMAELIGEEGIVHCACGEPAVMLRGVTNRPNGQPGEAQALCRDCGSK